jgi:hypothetical protein
VNQSEIDDFIDQSWKDAHAAARERLRECAEVLYQEESGNVNDPTAGDNLSAPFCGCDTCVAREVINAAHDDLEKYFLARVEKRIGFAIHMIGQK